jgi:hypothetical protein
VETPYNSRVEPENTVTIAEMKSTKKIKDSGLRTIVNIILIFVLVAVNPYIIIKDMVKNIVSLALKTLNLKI